MPREPAPFDEEVAFILKEAGRYLAKAPMRSDVRSVWVGLRPLVKPHQEVGVSTKGLSREHTVSVSPSRLVTVTGGKWTTYRHMAEDAVNKIEASAGLTPRPSVTKQLRLHGYSTQKDVDHFQVYGSDASDIRALAQQDAGLVTKLSHELGVSVSNYKYTEPSVSIKATKVGFD